MGHQPELDLRVIRRNDKTVGTGRNKCLADLFSLLGTDGDILQVGIVGTQPAGGGKGLVEGRMDFARTGADQGREIIYISR